MAVVNAETHNMSMYQENMIVEDSSLNRLSILPTPRSREYHERARGWDAEESSEMLGLGHNTAHVV
ncbi:hypothetical protein ACQP3D_28570, partial [Escherichia coli]